MSYFDAALFREALKGPGMDTRTWVSWGNVAEDSPDQHSVRFVDDEGDPFGEGPLVTVVLRPSGVTVVCRVATACAGLGESEWHPFVQGDDVLVVIPQGNTHAGCAIIGRGNNEIDAFPSVVAGQDVTGNTVGFKRLRSPFIVETASSYLIRSAVTGAQFGIDQTGQVIFNDGDGSRFFMGADAVGVSTADGSTSVQALVGDKQIAMTAGDVTSLLLDANASQFTSPGTLSIGTSGAQTLQHAVTLEQVVNMLHNLLLSLAVVHPGPLIGAAIAPTAPAIINGMLPLASIAPITPFQAAILLALTNPLPNADLTGQFPGVGRPGFLY